MKKLLAVCIVVLFFALLPRGVLAQTTTPAPTENTEGDGNENALYRLEPPLEEIDDTTETVSISFSDSDIDLDAFICLENDFCLDDDNIREGIIEGKQGVIETAALGLPLNKVDEATIQRYKLVDGEITVCGDGDKKLKAIGTENSHPHYEGKNGNYWRDRDNPGCEPQRDYFHAGKSYTFAVYERGESDGDETWALIRLGGFYINHHFPDEPPQFVDFFPPTNFDPDNVEFKVTVNMDKIKPNGNKKNTEYRNNYQVQLQAPGFSETRCGFFTEDQKSKTIIFRPQPDTLRTGRLQLTIREQVNEDSYVTERLGHLDFNKKLSDVVAALRSAPGYHNATATSLCRGGFVYRQYNCNIARVEGVSRELFTTTCELNKIANPDYNPDDPNSPQFIYQPYIDDPNKVDVKGLLAYFDRLGVNAADTRYPCNIGSQTMKDPSGCKVVRTAIGDIPTDPLGFVMRIFSIILSIAGIGAIVIIIFAGYRIMVSRGNPEALKSARESLTAAVIGLVFIVFSLVLLSIVAGNILRIPGFTDETEGTIDRVEDGTVPGTEIPPEGFFRN